MGRGAGSDDADTEPSYWALFANPETYRVQDAIRDSRTDRWVTSGKPIRRGDRVIIWQGKGRGRHRGVVAFGDVLTEPANLADSDNPYWVVPQRMEAREPRVEIRYLVPPGLPLWMDEHPELLAVLSISRARGGTVFNVTPAQWERVFAAAGGVPTSGAGGTSYRRADEHLAIAPRDPFEVDPEKIDRGNRGHAVTQNSIADFLAARRIYVRSPQPGEPPFDLAWSVGDVTYVAEVKSLTDANEEMQLRLGLGQVLRYRHLLGRGGRAVVAVLVLEREPSDPTWRAICEELGVLLVWPSAFERVL